MNRPSKDVDLLVRGLPIESLEALLAQHGDVDLVGKSFAVLKFVPLGERDVIDIALPRFDNYFSPEHRNVEVRHDHTAKVEDDLARRDFTMNAIAIDAVVRTVVDPHGGVSDALAGKIRTVGDARLRFAEDGLRAMRAVRFASQLGFRIDDATLLAIEPDLLSGVSRERIRDELVKTLNGIQPGEAIGVLHSTGLLQRAIGMPMADAAQCVAPVLGTVPTNLRLAVALCTAGIAPVNVKTLTQVLKFDSHEARTCSFAASAFSVLNADRSAYAVRRTLSLFGRDATMAAARALDDLAVATAVQHEPLITVRSLPFNGDDIMRELGLSGAAVGTAMRAGLAAAIVDPGLLEDRHGLLELVSKHSAA
jgi:tRNA nucleotidyltransferase/poly(A) polymerase